MWRSWVIGARCKSLADSQLLLSLFFILGCRKQPFHYVVFTLHGTLLISRVSLCVVKYLSCSRTFCLIQDSSPNIMYGIDLDVMRGPHSSALLLHSSSHENCADSHSRGIPGLDMTPAYLMRRRPGEYIFKQVHDELCLGTSNERGTRMKHKTWNTSVYLTGQGARNNHCEI